MLIEFLISFFSGVLVTVLGFVGKYVFSNWRHLSLLGVSIMKRKERIRISAAYLFRIKIDEKYLLIKGGRINQYQPVGGVYKTFPTGMNDLEKYAVERHTTFAGGEKSENDLRITLPGKNLLKFLDWFDTMTGREVNTWREFHEELVESGFLSLDTALASFNPRFIMRAPTKVCYSPHMKMDELLLFDIFEIALTGEAAEALRSIANDPKRPELLLLDADEIRQEHVIVDGLSVSVAGSAKWVLCNGEG